MIILDLVYGKIYREDDHKVEVKISKFDDPTISKSSLIDANILKAIRKEDVDKFLNSVVAEINSGIIDFGRQFMIRHLADHMFRKLTS